MKLTSDADTYTEHQEIFTGEIIARIADRLESAGLQGEALKDLTGKIAFDITSMIDSASEVSFEGVEVFPYLTFLRGEEELVHLGGNSYTHELVFGILNAMFSENT